VSKINREIDSFLTYLNILVHLVLKKEKYYPRTVISVKPVDP
jgi:hypothetical protein